MIIIVPVICQQLIMELAMYITLNTVRKQSKNHLKLLKVTTFLNIIILIVMMISSIEAKAYYEPYSSALPDSVRNIMQQHEMQDRYNEQLEINRNMERALKKLAYCNNGQCHYQ